MKDVKKINNRLWFRRREGVGKLRSGWAQLPNSPEQASQAAHLFIQYDLSATYFNWLNTYSEFPIKIDYDNS